MKLHNHYVVVLTRLCLTVDITLYLGVKEKKKKKSNKSLATLEPWNQNK